MWRQEHEKFRYFLTAPHIWKHIALCQLIEMIERMSLLSTAISWFVSLSIIWNSIFRNVGQRSHNERYKLRVLWKIMEEKHGCKHQLSGWPRTLENRENGGKNSLQGKIREFEILLKIREKNQGISKKAYLKLFVCNCQSTHTFCSYSNYYFAFPEQVFFLHGCIIKKLI